MRRTLLATAALFGMALAVPALAQNTSATPTTNTGTRAAENAKTSQQSPNVTPRSPAAAMRGISPGYDAGFPGGPQTAEAGSLGVEVSPAGTAMNPIGHAR